MKYKFYLQKISNSIMYSIDIVTEDLSLGVLTNFTDAGWTPAEVQEIIDGVLSTKSGKDEYRWANEDIFLVSRPDAVYFFDFLSRRASKEKRKGQDLTLSHDEFISFLKDFKKFVQEN